MGLDYGAPDGYGRYGIIDGDDARILCHECGKYYVSVGAHLGRAHAMTADEYRAKHGIPQRVPLAARALSATLSKWAHKKIGSEGWKRFEAARDPVAASHSRTSAAYERRGADSIAHTARAKRRIKGVTKPRSRRCSICGELIYDPARRVGCSDLCTAISKYEQRIKPKTVDMAVRAGGGESWSALGRQHGLSHVAVRERVKCWHRYLTQCSELRRAKWDLFSRDMLDSPTEITRRMGLSQDELSQWIAWGLLPAGECTTFDIDRGMARARAL